MRVSELIDHLMHKCLPNDRVFVNDKQACMTVEGTGYVSIIDHVIERRVETVQIQGQEFEVIR